MLHGRLTASVVLLLLAACGGDFSAGSGRVSLPPDAGAQNPPPTPAILVDPVSAQLVAGGSPLRLTAALTGTTASIVWSLDGPGSLSSTTGTSVTYVPPAALSGDSQATITASAGGVSGTATVALRALRIRVAGKVLGILGNPAPDVTVSIGERSTVTDAAGRFSIDDVGTPYSLTAFSVASNEAVVYQGLTRADPTILWRRPVDMVARSGQVAGTIDGGVPASTAGAQTLLVFSSPETTTQASTVTPDYSLPLNWRGTATTTGSVHALQVTSANQGDVPTSFPGHGVHTGVTAFDGVTTSGVDVTLTPPVVSSVRGTFGLPPDYSFFAKILALHFADGALMSIGFDASPGLDFTYLVPGDIEASVEITAEASAPGATVLRRETGIPPGSTDVDLVLPAGAPSLSPMDGADGVDSQTEFSWGPFSGGVFTVDFTAPGNGPTFHVVTTGTRTTLPQLTALPVPGGVQYVWTVTAAAPFSSVDDVAGPRPFEPEGRTLLKSFSDTLGFITR
jgi:hypothetical protein